MAWTAPMTAVSNAIWTSAQWNTHVRDNLLETMAGKATTAGRWFVSTGLNTIAERAISTAEVLTAETTASTTYANLTTNGPAVTVTTGTEALVFWTVKFDSDTANTACSAAVDIAGATTRAASDADRAMTDGITTTAQGNQVGMVKHFKTLTAGSNTFRIQYKVSAGTGTFRRREITVFAL